jgi:hypothetical protein
MNPRLARRTAARLGYGRAYGWPSNRAVPALNIQGELT